MQRRSAKLVRVLALAATATMLISALPASVATAAKGEVACKVHNLSQSSDRGSLQRAVQAAAPGDALLVQGRCSGTTLVDKDLDLSFMGWAGAPMPLGTQYIASPAGRIVSGGSRPALVIDPSVKSFTINPGLHVAGGIVIDDVSRWRSDAGSVPAGWRTAAPSTIASLPSDNLADCHMRNDVTGDEFGDSRQAMDDAASGDRLSLRGSCVGETVFDEAARVAGWRIAISGLSFGDDTADADDSGPATLARVSVDSDVDDLILRDVRVTDGFSITDLET